MYFLCGWLWEGRTRRSANISWKAYGRYLELIKCLHRFAQITFSITKVYLFVGLHVLKSRFFLVVLFKRFIFFFFADFSRKKNFQPIKCRFFCWGQQKKRIVLKEPVKRTAILRHVNRLYVTICKRLWRGWSPVNSSMMGIQNELMFKPWEVSMSTYRIAYQTIPLYLIVALFFC